MGSSCPNEALNKTSNQNYYIEKEVEEDKFRNFYDFDTENKENKDKEHHENIYKAYENFEIMIIKNPKLELPGFIVSTHSIQNFIKIIYESKVLENIYNYKRNLCKKLIKEKLYNYKIEKNIVVYDYNYCKNILENNNNEIKNEFIFVNYEFFEDFNIKNIGWDMVVYIDKINMKINFKNNNSLSFQKIKEGIYKFIKNEENKSANRKIDSKYERKEIELYSSRNNVYNDNLFKDENKNTERRIYKFDKNLDKLFKNARLKLYVSGKVFSLTYDKIAIISYDNLKIFETKFYTVICKIELKIERIINAIILDNNDLILLIKSSYSSKKKENKYYIQIYKLENEKYNLYQKIDDDKEGYHHKETCNGSYIFGSNYSLNNIKKLSENRFMTISNYGFKIYSLIQENNEYKYLYTLINEYDLYEDIKNIYEINDNEIIIINIYLSGNRFFPYTICLMDKFNINKNDLEKRVYKEVNNTLNISNYVILSKKLFIIAFGNTILILDIPKETIIKSFSLLSYYRSFQLYNYKYLGDNIFLLNNEANFYLFEFLEKSNELDIIGYLYKNKKDESLNQLKITNEFFILSNKSIEFLNN